jgi:hypothetical protein
MNTLAEARAALSDINRKLGSGEAGDCIAVYGDTLDALCTVQALMDGGVAGGRVVHISPAGAADTPLLGTACVDEDVRPHLAAALDAAGVRRVAGHIVGCATDGDGRIQAVELDQEGSSTRVACGAIALLPGRGVSRFFFETIDAAHLVYNGGLVIDQQLQTNDASILAGGPCTVYSRRYGADYLGHAGGSASEAGRLLAAQVLGRVDPLSSGRPKPPTALDLLPFVDSVVTQGLLPGALHYLRVSKPHDSDGRRALKGPGATAEMEKRVILRTGGGTPDGKLPPRFYSITIDERDLVVGITCVAKVGCWREG